MNNSINQTGHMLVMTIALAMVCTPACSVEDHNVFLDKTDVIRLSSYVGSQHLKTRPIAIEKIDDRTGVIGLMFSYRGNLRHISSGISNPNDEKAFIALNKKSVSRNGGVLTIAISNGPLLRFNNWKREETQDSDGDGESFEYEGILPNTEFHQINVSFVHDSPGIYLVNAKTGKILYTEEGKAILSNDSRKLLLIGIKGNLTVIDLTKDGDGIELQCAGDTVANPIIVSDFRTWHIAPYTGFDEVLTYKADNPEVYETAPVRFSQREGVWHMSVPNPERFSKLAKLACWQ
jgi:hypothetical protein